MAAPPPRRQCIFTSAGDDHAIGAWTAAPSRSWDLLAAWQGDDATARAVVEAEATLLLPGRGATFPDLAAALKARPLLLTGYDLVWVMDARLAPAPDAIERMFAIARGWALGVCQPAQAGNAGPGGLLARDPGGGLLRYTTLVGHACPLFRRERLERFLARYDGSLEGPALSHWMAQVLRGGPATGFAVVDAVELAVPDDAPVEAAALRRRGIPLAVPQTLARLVLAADAPAEGLPGGQAAGAAPQAGLAAAVPPDAGAAAPAGRPPPGPAPAAPCAPGRAPDARGGDGAPAAGAAARPAAAPSGDPDLALVRQEMAEVTLGVLSRASTPLPPPESPIAIAVVRDEALLLPDFLRHHRGLGVRRFCFIDNGSADGTQALLAAQPDVDLFECRRPFDWRLKHGWINRAIAGYGHGRWFLHLDADEQLVFDGAERHGIEALTALMDRRGIRRVRGLLVDMYADAPLLEAPDPAGRPLAEAFPFHDREGYRQFRLPGMIAVRGGPRRRVFARAGADFDPELSKLPLFRLAEGELSAHPHRLWPHAGNFASPRVLALLHFKFLPAFAEKMRRAVAEANYWRGSLEYRCYQQVLAKQPDLTLHGPHSACFRGSAGLVEAGVIEALDWPPA